MTAVVVLAAVRAVVASSGPAGISPDSSRYRNPSDPLLAFRFDLANGPGQLVQVVFLFPLPLALALQAVLAALIWGWAALVATRDLAWPWFWIVLGFGLSPWWLVWDSRVLTEALTLAGIALFASGAGRWMAGRHAALPMVAGAAIALLSRPLVVPLVLGILIVACIVRRRVPGPRTTGALLVALLLLAGVQSVVFGRALATYDWLPEPVTLLSHQASDRVAARGRLPGYLELAAASGMPNCPQVSDLAAGFEGSTALRRLPCPGIPEWLDRGGLAWWKELALNPGPTLTEATTGAWVRESWWLYGSETWRPIMVRWIRERIDLVMWAVLGASVVALLRPGRGWTGRAAVTVGTAAFALVMIMVDGLENWRHILPALAVLLPFAVAGWPRAGDDAPLPRPRRRREVLDPASTAGPPPPGGPAGPPSRAVP